MKMSMIPREHVTKVWNNVSGLLEKATILGRQRHDIVDIFEQCVSGKQILWIVFDEENDNSLMGALTTSSIAYPRYVTLSIMYMGGKELMRYLDLIIDTLSRFSRDNGYTSIEICGREGWGRVCKKHGFTKAYSVIELDLTEDNKMAAE